MHSVLCLKTKFFIWNCCIWNQSISIQMNDSISLWIVNQYFHVANRWMWIRFRSFLKRHIPRTHRQYPNDSTRLPMQQSHWFSSSNGLRVYIYICIYIYIHIYIQSLFMNFCIYVNASIFMHVYSCIYLYNSYHSNKFFKHYKRSITWPEFTNLTWMHYSTLFAFPSMCFWPNIIVWCQLIYI